MNPKVVLLLLLLSFDAFAESVEQGKASVPAMRVAPLTPEELAPVVAEIQRMIKTDERNAKRFVVREATPERIERAYVTPSFLQQPRNVRENGLIFAGQGPQLAFEKPSDVITKLQRWFPQEIAAARNDRHWSFFTHLHLYGPFPAWQTEPAAFLALWNCLPKRAWLKPDDDPFARRLNDSLPLLPNAAQSSSLEEYEFGLCVRERSGRIAAFSEAELLEVTADQRAIAQRVAPYLQQFFARFLATNGCRGTGPDDCVLILRSWASLEPADPALAAMLRKLEPEIAPEGPLPPFLKPLDQYGQGGQEGEPRFDALLRRGAFLRAKLRSIESAPSVWPADALPAMLQQLTVQQALTIEAGALDHRWSYAALGYYNEAVNPWNVVSAGIERSAVMRAAVLGELARLTDAAPCALQDPWFAAGKPWLGTAYALPRFAKGETAACAAPDWAWMQEGKTAPARALRDDYLQLLAAPGHAARREVLLTQFTGQGAACFEPETLTRMAWLRPLCAEWISEPQHTPLALAHSQLTLGDSQQIRPALIALPAALEVVDVGPEQVLWLDRLLVGLAPAAKRELHQFALELEKRNARVMRATLWRDRKHPAALLALDLRDDERPHALLMLGPEGLTHVNVPARFDRERNQLVAVSDLDDDGNLELWWASSFRHCEMNEEDLQRDIDCAAKQADMGEVQGDTLSYFLRSPPLPRAAAGSAPRLAANVAVARPGPEEAQCNRLLVGSVLGDVLPIHYGGDEESGGRGDVIGMVCKPHPVRGTETVVALFFDFQPDAGTDASTPPKIDSADSADAPAQKGFALAIIDLERKRVVAFHRSVIEEDASIRVGEFGLHLDLGRYLLAPGVRAVGVRMDIGYGPRCAEGGESNYLTLFVQEGQALRPVLKDLAMSRWRIVEGSNACGQDEHASYEQDNVTLTIELGDPGEGGWRDLRVIAEHRIEGSNAVPAPVAPHGRREAVTTLRARNGTYEAVGVGVFR